MIAFALALAPGLPKPLLLVHSTRLLMCTVRSDSFPMVKRYRERSVARFRHALSVASLLDELTRPVLPSPSVRLPALATPAALPEIEDRRTFYPERAFRPALALGRQSRVRSVPKMRGSVKLLSPEVFVFDAPKRVAICVRRKVRREVLMARGKARSRKIRRRNFWSNVECR